LTSLSELYCDNNRLSSLPLLPDTIRRLDYSNNPIYSIITETEINIINIKQQIINKFRYLYYCLKFRTRLRNMLWIKIREPKIQKKYNPRHLLDMLNDNVDMFVKLLNEW
jgi:hypothetical protein